MDPSVVTVVWSKIYLENDTIEDFKIWLEIEVSQVQFYLILVLKSCGPYFLSYFIYS